MYLAGMAFDRFREGRICLQTEWALVVKEFHDCDRCGGVADGFFTQSFSGAAFSRDCAARTDTADDPRPGWGLGDGDFAPWPFNGLESAKNIRQDKTDIEQIALKGRAFIISTGVIGAVSIF